MWTFLVGMFLVALAYKVGYRKGIDDAQRIVDDVWKDHLAIGYDEERLLNEGSNAKVRKL